MEYKDNQLRLIASDESCLASNPSQYLSVKFDRTICSNGCDDEYWGQPVFRSACLKIILCEVSGKCDSRRIQKLIDNELYEG